MKRKPWPWWAPLRHPIQYLRTWWRFVTGRWLL